MSKRRKKNVETTNTISRMRENIESIAHNPAETNNNITELVKTSKSKMTIIIYIIALFLQSVEYLFMVLLKSLSQSRNMNFT